jgi:recombination protein RecA
MEVMMAQDEKRQEALKQALAQIEKQYGKGSIMKLGSEERAHIEGLTTGSLSLDIALGGKGIPRGRVVEVFGPEASGKTTLCLTVVANVQKDGGTAAYIDAEHALDATYAKKLGVILDELLLSQPDYGEQALDIAETLVRSNAVDVIIVDSVAALLPKTELEGEIGDQQIGLQARLMSQALRKLTACIGKSKTAVIFINQIREKIGMFGFGGSPETTPGGRALKFYSSVRIDLRKIQTLKEGDIAYGTRVRANVVKNKVAAPFKKSEFDILFDSGISYEGNLLDIGEDIGLLEKSGVWYVYKGERLGQGREKAREFLKQNNQIASAIELDIKKQIGIIEETQSEKDKKLEKSKSAK